MSEAAAHATEGRRGSRSRTIQRQLAERRERARISQLVLRKLPRTLRAGTYPVAIRPFVNDMEREAHALLQHLGGEGNASEVQLALVRDAAIAGATLAVAFARLVQRGGEDDEAMAKIAGLVGTRTRILQALGLQRIAKELDLSAYLRERETAREPADGQPDANQSAEPEPAREVAADPQPMELVVEAEPAVEEGSA
jgi:hypothetical protein